MIYEVTIEVKLAGVSDPFETIKELVIADHEEQAELFAAIKAREKYAKDNVTKFDPIHVELITNDIHKLINKAG